jgi:acetyl esterase/lipase
MKKYLLLILFLAPLVARGEHQSETVRLWDGDAPGAKGQQPTDIPTLKSHWPKKQGSAMPAVLLAPGGGYKHLSGIGPYAREFSELGIVVFYLSYRLPVNGYPQPYPLRDAQRALSTIRSKAKEWNLDPAKIGVIGFSSGGHVASSLCVHHQLKTADQKDEVDKVDCTPDFALLWCPVITMKTDAHTPSVVRLLGQNPDQKLLDYYSNEEQVDQTTPPTFLCHAADDMLVKVENSKRYHAALQQAGVCSTLLIYAEPCGHSVPDKVEFWREPMRKFLKRIKVIE